MQRKSWVVCAVRVLKQWGSFESAWSRCQKKVMETSSEIKLSVIGLGYVGLPLAVEFGKQRRDVEFDINLKRITYLKAGQD